MQITPLGREQLRDMLKLEAEVQGTRETARILGCTSATVSKIVLGQRRMSTGIARLMGFEQVGAVFVERDDD